MFAKLKSPTHQSRPKVRFLELISSYQLRQRIHVRNSAGNRAQCILPIGKGTLQ